MTPAVEDKQLGGDKIMYWEWGSFDASRGETEKIS